MVMHHVGTKSRSQVSDHGKKFALRIRADPSIEGAHLLSVLEKPNKTEWSEDEHRKFSEGLELYDKDWNKVSQHVGTRSPY